MNSITILLQSVSKRFNQNQVLSDITYRFDQQHTYAITGHSGSGKSTLLHLVAGLDIPTEGAIFYNEMQNSLLSNIQKENFLCYKFGLLFQVPYLIDELSVIENVMTKGLIAGIPYQACYAEALFLLQELGIIQKAEDYPRSLSGGQQQRVALARALLLRPSFLLADEPTGNLDESTGMKIIDLLLKYHTLYGMGLIISSHDDYVVRTMDYILELKNGILTEAIKE